MKSRIFLTMILSAVTVAGCAPTNCAGWRPIEASASDSFTRLTKEQIVAHNEFGAKQCGWRPGRKAGG